MPSVEPFQRAEHDRPDPTHTQPDPDEPRSRVDREGRLRPLTADERRDYADRLREGLDALERIGTEAERRETLNDLMEALAATRRMEGRPF